MPWPTDRRIPDEAFTNEGVAIVGYAKLRPCLVVTLAEEIDDLGVAQVLPISTFKSVGQLQDGLLKGNHIPHLQFLPGNGARLQDGYVDFRWTWRLKSDDLGAGIHEAELDEESLVLVLLRFRDYIYLAPG